VFGKLSSRKQRHLQEAGTRAPATVVSIAERGMAITNGADNVVANTTLELRTTFRVEPPGGAPFEVTRPMRYAQLAVPAAGQRVNVIYDPDDTETLMIDESAPVVAGFGGADLSAMLHTIQDAKERSGGDPAKLTEILQGTFGPGATVIGSADEGPKYVSWPPGTGAAAPAPDPEDAKIDQLERLAKLHASGALTDAEFAAQKARVLGA